MLKRNCAKEETVPVPNVIIIKPTLCLKTHEKTNTNIEKHNFYQSNRKNKSSINSLEIVLSLYD